MIKNANVTNSTLHLDEILSNATTLPTTVNTTTYFVSSSPSSCCSDINSTTGADFNSSTESITQTTNSVTELVHKVQVPTQNFLVC